MKLPESKLAHKYLDGLRGLEIGGSAHNPFGLNTRNVDYTDNQTIFKREELEQSGSFLPVDIVAPGDNLPLPDDSEDFVVSSHVLEHFSDPIKALKEWYRVVKEGGYIFMIIPHKERTFDRNQPPTSVEELIKRHETGIFPEPHSKSKHYSFWTTENFLDLILMIDLGWKIIEFQDVDDKIGNGFAVVIKKEKAAPGESEKIKGEIEKLRLKKAEKDRKKFKRIRQLFQNGIREIKRNGLRGLLQRIKTFNKWDGE